VTSLSRENLAPSDFIANVSSLLQRAASDVPKKTAIENRFPVIPLDFVRIIRPPYQKLSDG